MATVTVYNRDGTEYGTLDTSKYIFNNSLIGFEPKKLDINMYPYVKINGTYYVNDGEEFQSVERSDNSAALMDKNHCYKWGNQISPINLFFFEDESISHPEGKGRIVFENLTENGFEYNKTYYESFRVGNEWVGNYQPTKKWRVGNFGYKTKKDDEQKDPYVAPFFNFGKATLITTNLYNKYIMPNFSLQNGMFIIDNKTYSSNDYDILLYFTPSLNKTISAICPVYGANKPTDGVGVYRPYIRTPFPNKPDGKSGNNWPEYSEVYYQIGFTSSGGNSEITLTYDKGKCYKIDWNQQTGSFIWGSKKWIPIDSIKPDDFLVFKDSNLTGKVPSYYKNIENFLAYAGENYMDMLESNLDQDRVLLHGRTYFASAYMSFRIKLKNIPSFKNDKDKHENNCSVNDGRLSGYSNSDNNFTTDSGEILWTTNRSGVQDPTKVHSIGPIIDFSEQTIYRNKQAIQDFEATDWIDANLDKLWSRSEMSIKCNNSTFESGFYCLFAFPKGVL